MPSEQEIKEMQEKIKNMSPEELKEFQKQQCVFCHIVKGEVASRKVYEDDKCIAVLDINPANPGHILLIPKEHYVIMPLIPDEPISHIFMVSKQISQSLLKSIGAQGTNIFIANGAAAGQKAQHFMVHIIPRMEKDNLSFKPGTIEISEKQFVEMQKKLAPKVSKDLGKEYPIVSEETTEEKEDKEERKDKKAKKGKKSEKNEVFLDRPGREAKEDVSLDDIAKFITGK